jgi:hypothetical protein
MNLVFHERRQTYVGSCISVKKFSSMPWIWWSMRGGKHMLKVASAFKKFSACETVSETG